MAERPHFISIQDFHLFRVEAKRYLGNTFGGRSRRQQLVIEVVALWQAAPPRRTRVLHAMALIRIASYNTFVYHPDTRRCYQFFFFFQVSSPPPPGIVGMRGPVAM